MKRKIEIERIGTPRERYTVCVYAQLGDGGWTGVSLCGAFASWTSAAKRGQDFLTKLTDSEVRKLIMGPRT
jgi:hypothetical protein